MPLPIFKRLVKGFSHQQYPPLNGEILYSRNNVCVHPSGSLSNSDFHNLGFLTISAVVDDNHISLIFNWSPTINSNVLNTKCVGQKLTKLISPKSKSLQHTDSQISIENLTTSETTTSCSLSNKVKCTYCESESTCKSVKKAFDFQSLENSSKVEVGNLKYNYLMKSMQGSIMKCFSICIDLLRSIRIYFRNEKCTCGELVIATLDFQYKVLHFHSGGLDGVAAILEHWKAEYAFKSFRLNPYDHISTVFSNLSSAELHPEEGLHQCLSGDIWAMNVDELGRIKNKKDILKSVFFEGVNPELRPIVWLYLLKTYQFSLTGIERNEIKLRNVDKYRKINDKRLEIFETANVSEFWKDIASAIEKDVIRTDRCHPFYKGEKNSNVYILKNILLNYAVFTKSGYSQGMSDLLSPILVEIQEESDVFWCFVGLMQQTTFSSYQSDSGMKKHLFYLIELLRVLLPDFYSHLVVCGPDAMELLFVHRWILLCFRREFSKLEALKIWEACLAQYHCDYFHLFVCVAIIALYGADIVENKLAVDETLLHFSHLAMQMNGALVLKKARGLLYQMQMHSAIPCTLYDLLFVLPKETLPFHKMPLIVCANTPQCTDTCLHGGRKNLIEISKIKIKKLFT